jgi:hypothetical protein
MTALTERERADNRRAGRLRGLQRAREARAATREAQRRRLSGEATGDAAGP